MNEIVAKFRRLQDRVNFCCENGLYSPKFPGFDRGFFLLALKGSKNLSPIGGFNGYEFPYI